VSSERPTTPRPQPTLSSVPGRRRGTGWRWAAAVAVSVAAVIAAAAAGAFSGGGSQASGAGSAYRTSTALVVRRSLASQTNVDATLGDRGSYTVIGQATGTYTRLPALGAVIRQGQVLYRVDDSPVVLLYGRVPAFRDLSEGVSGSDVRQLNTDLVRLGYLSAASLGPRSGWNYDSSETASGWERLAAHLGVTDTTGTVTLGQVVFLPGPVKVSALGTGVVPGSPAQPGGGVLTGTSTTPQVTINLDASMQSEVTVGDPVTVTLPDGTVTGGVVTSVGEIAMTNAVGDTTVAVEVALTHPAVAGHLDQAPVTVSITTGKVANALVVPVDALLAQPGGGYAVEEVTAAGAHHLVKVSLGLFDDAAGLVQVSGPGLAPGQRVVVPSL
jgi:hypothetical protein